MGHGGHDRPGGAVRRFGLAVAGLALAVGPVLPAPAAVAQEGCLGELGLDDPGAAMPVVLVHGFTGSPADLDVVADRLEATPGEFAVYRFDYSAVNTRWVDDDAIGPKLRRWVLCLSDASSDGGGVGRVGIVAHSMGGLAARYALRDTGDGSIADRVAVVATLGTPHQGSVLAGPPNDGSAGSALARSLFDAYVAAPFGPTSNLDTPAARALAVGSPELAQLADWPDGVAVWAGAGQFIAEQRFFFYHREDPAGDLVVSEESATALAPEHDRLGGTDTSECRIPIPHDLTTVGVAGGIGYALDHDPTLLDCYHGLLTHSDRLLVPLITQLTAAANRTPREEPQGPDQPSEVVCDVVREYIGSPERERALSPVFSAFIVALQDSGLAGIMPFIDGPIEPGSPINIFVGSPSGESIFRYEIGPSTLIGPEVIGGGPHGATLPDVDLPGPEFNLDVGNTGYRVLASDRRVLCNSRFDAQASAETPSPLGNPDAPPNWLCVVGVAEGDTLNVRSGPGTNLPVVHEIPPGACDSFATGRESMVEGSNWIEIDFYDHTFHIRGWINSSYVEQRPNPCYWEPDACGL